MFDMIFWFAVGLLVGWNLLSQPEWVKSAVGWVVDKVKGLF